MKKEDKILLIFPPLWVPDAPFLSTPTLTAFLKQNKINVEQIDLNIEFWNHLYSEKFINKLHVKIKSRLSHYLTKDSLSNKGISIFKKVAIVGKLSTDQFREEIKKRIIPIEIYLDLIGTFSEFRISDPIKGKLIAEVDEEFQGYNDLLYKRISYSLFSHSISDLQKIVSLKSNPYAKFYKYHTIKNIILKKPNILGISIAESNQVVPAFTLAKIIKDNLPNCKIVIGGSWCSLTNEDLGNRINSFPYIDFMIPNEGEYSLLNLAKIIFNKGNTNELKGVYYKKGSRVIYHKSTDAVKLSELDTPDYSGLDLDSYFERGTLPIQGSRGCSWGKCIFCSYPVLESKYKLRSVDLIIDDIIKLQAKHKAKVFSFVDSLITPAFAKQFSEKLISNNIIIEWVMLARFEKQFSEELLNKMKQSGCTTICWGLESGNQRVLNEINKNIDLPRAKAILSMASEAGIHNRVLVMYALPSEKPYEAYDTINFIKDNSNHIHSISYNFYHPEKNTPIENYCFQNGISLLNQPKNNLSFGYSWTSSIDNENLKNLSEEYIKLEGLIHNKKISGTNSSKLIFNLIKDKTLIEAPIPFNKDKLSIVSTIDKKAYGRVKRCFYEIQNY